jgi:molybdenum cofactor cytidylyltransferase
MCRPVVVVLGSRASQLELLLQDQPVEIVINQDWSLGMGTSIRAGVSAIMDKRVDAVLLFLCDQPLVNCMHLDRMIEVHLASGKAITAACYAGTFGTPVIFAASLFDELLALGDAEGGKIVLGRHLDQVQPFPLPEAQADVDTPEEFARLPGTK